MSKNFAPEIDTIIFFQVSAKKPGQKLVGGQRTKGSFAEPGIRPGWYLQIRRVKLDHKIINSL
jgi:hypothetical protein